MREITKLLEIELEDERREVDDATTLWHSFNDVIDFLCGANIPKSVRDVVADCRQEVWNLRAGHNAKVKAIHTLLNIEEAEPTEADQPVNVKSEATDPPSKPRKATRESLRAGLDDEALADIRQRAGEGESYVNLGAAYNVSRSTIGNIIQHKGCYK